MSNGVLLHARLAWLLGVRSRAFRSLVCVGIFLLGAAWLNGAFSLRQPAIVAMDVGISGLRLLGTFFVLYWVQEIFVKDIERRTAAMALAYPVSRTEYMLGRWLGVALLVAMTIVFWAVGLLVLANVSDWGYAGSVRPEIGLGYALVLLGIFFDLLAVSMFVVWLASVAQTPILPFLGGVAFAVAARLIGPSAAYMRFSTSADKDMSATMLPLLDVLRWLIPDLSRLDWRQIVLYGQWPPMEEMLSGLAVASGYILLFAVLATSNYNRREFS